MGDPASYLCCMTQSRSLHPASLQMGCKRHTVWISVCISLLAILGMSAVTIMFMAQWDSMVWGLSPELAPNPAVVKGGTDPAVAWPSLRGCSNLFAAPFCSLGSSLRLHNSLSKAMLLICSFSLACIWHSPVLEGNYGITGDVSTEFSPLCHLSASIQKLQGSPNWGAVFSASVWETVQCLWRLAMLHRAKSSWWLILPLKLSPAASSTAFHPSVAIFFIFKIGIMTFY